MSDPDILIRFEELEAGRILGDLDAEETMEWQKLSKDPRCQPDLSLELVATAIETDYLQDREVNLPANVMEDLQKSMAEFTTSESGAASIIRPPRWQTLLRSSQTAWSIAALFIILFVAQSLTKTPKTDPSPKQVITAPPEPTPAEALAELKKQSKASDLIVTTFGGIEEYNQMSGQVTWSDTMQEGYMTLTNLPANDPTAKQYQLWIFDPSRDEKPVDGGVFDIPSGGGTVIIPIRNPLTVTTPKAFVITLEQPGGVVVSKKETVVALAKAS